MPATMKALVLEKRCDVEDFQLIFINQQALRSRYGPLVDELKQAEDSFATVILRASSLDRLRRSCREFQGSLATVEADDSLTLGLPRVNSIVEFVQ